MKINWRVLAALVLIVGAIYWALSSLLPSSYSGANLNFGVGSGLVTVTNLSNEPVPVQLVAPRTRTFAVSSATEGIAGSSTRLGSGSSSTNVLEFELPSGISEFTIVRGSEVKFVANTTTRLQATVNPLSADAARTTLIVAIVIVLVSLFYASKVTNHGWIRALRPQKTSVQETRPIAVPNPADVNRGRDGRMYSDG